MPAAADRPGLTAIPAGTLARFRADGAALGLTPPLAIAVSGGPDSLALLLLGALAYPGRIVAATVDHGLRPTAADEARAVAALCATLAVPHAILPVTVARGGQGVQAAARRARYAALEDWATARRATALLTAHHMDDQAETILMRLARGAGIAGLASIRRRRALGRIMLARPLLGWRKAELAAIVAAAGIDAADDPANRDPRFDRAHARALLAATPWLAPARLVGLAPLAAEIEEALGWAEAQAAARIAVDADGRVTLDATGLPQEIRRRLLLRALALAAPAAPPPRGPALIRLLAALDDGRIATLAGVRVAPGPPWRLTPAPPHRSA